MNNLKTSDVLDPTIQQPFTAISAAFLQDATLEMIVATVRAIVGESYSVNTPYAIIGVTYTGSVSTPTSVAPGYILFQGDLIGVNSGFGPAASGAQFTKVTTNTFTYNAINADPVAFTDNITRNVHNIIKYTIVDAASGGLFQLSDVVYIQDGSIQKTTATLVNTFAGTLQYYKDYRGFVHVRGTVTVAEPRPSTVFFTLPVGFRPTNNKRIPVTAENVTLYPAYVQITTAGVMNFGSDVPTAGGTTSVYLDGISFYTGW